MIDSPPQENTIKNPIRYARISLYPNCSLKCRYCRPVDGVEKKREELLPFRELRIIIKSLRNLGVQKFRFTGGEPFARPGVFSFLKDTGLEKYYITSSLHIPAADIEKINSLAGAGLVGVNVSLDTLDCEKYRALTGGSLELVKSNLRKLDIPELKLNTILIENLNEDSALDIIDFSLSIGATPRFIEKMDLISDGLKGAPLEQLREQLISSGVIETTGRTVKNSVSRYHRLKGRRGEVGFITPMSVPFCGSCDKVRITSSGKLKLCLFEEGARDLKETLKSGPSRLEEQLRDILKLKKLERAYNRKDINMARIGG